MQPENKKNQPTRKSSQLKRKRSFDVLFRAGFGLLTIAIVGLIALFVITRNTTNEIIYTNVLSLVQADKYAQAHDIDEWFGIAKQTIEVLASTLSVLSCTEDFQAIATHFVEQFYFIDNVFIGFADGNLINGQLWTPPSGWYVTERPWFISAYEADPCALTITAPHLSQSTGATVVSITTFVPELGGVGAAVGASVTLDTIIEQVRRHTVFGDGFITLVDLDGYTIAHPQSHLNPTISRETGTLVRPNIYDLPNGSHLMEAMRLGESPRILESTFIGEAYFFGSFLNSVDWMLVAIVPRAVTSEPISQYTQIILRPAIILLSMMFIVSMLFVLYLVHNMEVRRMAEDRLSAIFEGIPMSVCLRDREHNIFHSNSETINLFGLNTADEYMTKFNELSPMHQPCGRLSSELALELTAKAFDEGELKVEWMHRRLNGEPLPAEVSFTAINIDDKDYLVTIVRDLREFHKMQAQEREANDKLRRTQDAMRNTEEQSRAKDRFIARVSHEIRTPISTILGISEIELQQTNLHSRIEESFAKIHDSAGLLLSIINDILDFSKIEAGKMPVIPATYEMSSLVNDVSQLQLAYQDSKHIEFLLDINENLPTHLIGDSLRIRQILTNLLSNAFKYTTKGLIQLVVDFEQSLAGNKEITLVITVSDTGLGMTKEQLTTLYEEYARFHENESIATGTGLGMSIVYSLVKMMNGNIDTQSQLDKGTTVTVRIPQTVASDKVIGRSIADSLQKFETTIQASAKRFNFIPEQMPHGRVLVVDDIDANLYVARGLLMFYNLQIETCNSGRKAIEKIKEGNEYDVIFMDQTMPELSGTCTMRQLRTMGYTRPIVVLTANALIGHSEEFLKGGFDGFISKPINTSHLNTILMKFVKPKPRELHDTVTDNINNFLTNPDTVRKLRVDFAKTQSGFVEKMQNAITSGDMETAHRLAHSLKGLAGLIKEEPLVASAQALEDMFDANCVVVDNEFESMLRNLETELGHVLSTIEPEAERPQPARILDKDSAMQIFSKLEPLLATRNTQALQLISQLQTIPGTELLTAQIEGFEFAKAEKTLKELVTTTPTGCQ